MKLPFLAAITLLAVSPTLRAAEAPIVLEGKDGPGKGKHIVLLSGDQEYRSEEAISQLAKILAKQGFKCTVLFTVDPDNGTINPTINNVPGLESLKSADMLLIFTRFLNLPDDQMQLVADYVESGKPIVALRTSTHAFNIPKGRKFARFGNDSSVDGWKGGFGRTVLGERWVAHHGAHGKEGTRGIVAKGQEGNPIFRGIKPGDIFGTTDVYTAHPPSDCTVLVYGQVTASLMPDSKAVEGKKNDPMMPVAWTRTYKGTDGTGRIFTTTMGASEDLQFEGTRRMIVNACYWAVGLESKIPERSDVGIVGTFKPTHFQFKSSDEWKKAAVKPADLFK